MLFDFCFHIFSLFQAKQMVKLKSLFSATLFLRITYKKTPWGVEIDYLSARKYALKLRALQFSMCYCFRWLKNVFEGFSGSYSC